MSASIISGPWFLWGSLGNLLSAPGQGQAASVSEPDPNQDAAPSVLYQGAGIPDVRCFFAKDQVGGFLGVVPALMLDAWMTTSAAIPAALAADNVAAAQNAVSGTAMTLAAASVGITLNVPIIPFTGYGQMNQGTVVTTGLALDFGFGFVNATSGNTQVTVSDSTLFPVGMPLVIGGIGNAGGTTCLLTTVASIVSSTAITLADAPLATNATAPVGTGNLYNPVGAGTTPTAALPYLAGGPGLYLDPRQSLSRVLRIVGTGAGCSGGDFLVTFYDVYGMLGTETVTVAAGASTGYMRKTAKYIVSVVPQFSDANDYTVGTADVFGFGWRLDSGDDVRAVWNSAQVTDGVGFVVADQTNPATATTDDVRGVIQVSATGAGTPITSAAASNGSIVSLAMSGRKLTLSQRVPIYNMLRATAFDTRTAFGVTQA